VASIQEKRAGNVADLTVTRATTPWDCTLEIEDGHIIHAPVGSFAPDAFGVHDVLGNVWEWCLDAYGPYSNPPRKAHGLRSVPGASVHVYRSGTFRLPALFARSASRGKEAAGSRFFHLGARPVRSITP
jgi:formylglycine-generating enzyme required for sulfatase activity